MRKLFITAVLAFGMNATAQGTLSGGIITNPSFSTGSTAIGANAKIANGATNATQIGEGINGVSNSINLGYNTTVNGNLTTNSTLRAGAGGANAAAILNGYAEVKQNLYVGGTSITYGDAIVKKNLSVDGTAKVGVLAVGANKVTINGANGNTIIQGVTQTLGGVYVGERADGTPALQVAGSGWVKGDLNVNGKITSGGVELVNVNQLNATNTNVAANTTAIANLQSTKADKVQVAQDIAKAKQEANTYTDTKVKAVNDKLDLEIEANKIAQKKLDDKINSNDEKINQRVRDLEIKIDNRFNGVMSYVTKEFNAVNNRLEGLGASMVALSAAATSSVYNPIKPTNLNIATGVYGRGYAIAGGLSHFFNDSTKVSVNWSNGSNTKNAVGVGVGFAF